MLKKCGTKQTPFLGKKFTKNLTFLLSQNIFQKNEMSKLPPKRTIDEIVCNEQQGETETSFVRS